MAYMTVDELNDIADVQGMGWNPAALMRRKRKKRARRKLTKKQIMKMRQKAIAARGVAVAAPPPIGVPAAVIVRGVSIGPGTVAPIAPPIGVPVAVMKQAITPAEAARRAVGVARRKKKMAHAARNITARIARIDAVIARYTKQKEALLAQQAGVVATGTAEAIVSDLMGW